MSSLGEVQPRDGSGAHLVQGDAEGFSRTHKLSIGAALFPLLHPGGKGAFKTGDSLEGLLSQRIHLLSVPFTLIKEYLLVMFHDSCVLPARHG
jgi:hypothetical protein